MIQRAGGLAAQGIVEPDKEQALERIAGLFETIGKILRESQNRNEPTETVAERVAFERIAQERQRNVMEE